MINYVLTLIVCYLGLIGGFIVHKFAKEELVKIRKKSIWFVQQSEIIYIVLALIFSLFAMLVPTLITMSPYGHNLHLIHTYAGDVQTNKI